jgi:class II lanthipeptide synthase
MPRFVTAWCHGAPGIALARAACRHAVGEGEPDGQLQRAIDTTLGAALDDRDFLCCGNLGRAEIAWTVGRLTGNEGACAAARSLTARIVSRARRFGYGCHPHLPRGIEDPSFFRGIAGIGYHLLRLADPERFPCVLLLE